MSDLTSLTNIGKELERKLKAVGIDTAEKLIETGSKGAFFKLKETYPNVCLVHLYTLEGAISNTEYNALSEDKKKELKKFSDSLRGNQNKGEITMKNDILFKEDNFIFSYRVAGLLIQNNKILLQKPKGDDYSLIGGHVSRFEVSEDTLKREFMEEIHAEIAVDSLFAVGETFWRWGKTPCHQIGLYYKVHLIGNDIPLEGSFWGMEGHDDRRYDMKYCWVSLDELRNGVKMYPLELVPYILNDKNEVVHFVSRQI